MDTLQRAKQLCIAYEKYLITIRFDEVDYYLVWGADSTDRGDDKLLVDEEKNILLFRKQPDALTYILEASTPLLDVHKLKEWATASLTVGTYSSYLYDLDELRKLVDNDRLRLDEKARREDVLYWVNFINLVGDYAIQINEVYLLKARESESIRSFWEYGYDTFFWTIPEPELTVRQESSLAAFQYAPFKTELLNLLLYIKSCFVVLPI